MIEVAPIPNESRMQRLLTQAAANTHAIPNVPTPILRFQPWKYDHMVDRSFGK
jgi:hypothetical protein